MLRDEHSTGEFSAPPAPGPAIATIRAELTAARALLSRQRAALERAHHDLRGSVGAMIGFAELLDKPELEQREREIAQRIGQAGRRTLEMLQRELLGEPADTVDEHLKGWISGGGGLDDEC